MTLKSFLLLADPVMIINADQKIIAINKAFEKASGYSSSSLYNKDFTSFSCKKCVAFHQMKSWEGKLYLRKQNGDKWLVSVTMTPIFIETDTFYVGVFRNFEAMSGSFITEEETRKMKKDILKVLAISCESRDPGIESHLMRVQSLTEELIYFHNERCQLNLDHEYMDNIIHSSILHDIGKASIPEGILYKPGALTKYERMIIETHPLSGVDILNKISKDIDLDLFQESFKVARNVILYHHEKWDGTGYPQKLSGYDIPFEARVVGIVDVFEALTSRRSYKEAWTTERALALLNEKKGKHFDPELVESFIQLKQTTHQSA